jgi:hypothetical protein
LSVRAFTQALIKRQTEEKASKHVYESVSLLLLLVNLNLIIDGKTNNGFVIG